MTNGLELVARGVDRVKNDEKEVVRFVRTSEGRGVGVIRIGGFGEVWRLAEMGEERGSLVHVGDFEDTDFVVVLDRGELHLKPTLIILTTSKLVVGHTFATYSSANSLLILHTKTHPSSTLPVPKLESLFTYPTPTSATLSTRPEHPGFTAESIFGITPDFYIVHIRIEASTGKMALHSHDRLPTLPKLPSTTRGGTGGSGSGSGSSSEDSPGPRTPTDIAEPPFSGSGSITPDRNASGNAVKKILPVDPMAWGWDWDEWDGYRRSSGDGGAITRSPVSPFLSKSRIRFDASGNGRGGWEEHDVLLSVSECGELAFWVPEAYTNSNLVNGNDNDIGNGGKANGAGGVGSSGWRCTGRVRTGRRGFNRARCSSAKKTALGEYFLLSSALFSVANRAFYSRAFTRR